MECLFDTEFVKTKSQLMHHEMKHPILIFQEMMKYKITHDKYTFFQTLKEYIDGKERKHWLEDY